jgi:hypothetical protein
MEKEDADDGILNEFNHWCNHVNHDQRDKQVYKHITFSRDSTAKVVQSQKIGPIPPLSLIPNAHYWDPMTYSMYRKAGYTYNMLSQYGAAARTSVAFKKSIEKRMNSRKEKHVPDKLNQTVIDHGK